MKKLIVVIPAFNEEASIAKVIKKIPRHFSPQVKVEVLVVNDGSVDQTVSIAKEAGAEYILSFSVNRGLGAAVREGLKEAYRMGADLAVMIDADDEYPADHIPRVAAPILTKEADYVLASRFKRRVRGMKVYRRLGNYFFTLLQVLLLKRWLSDGQTGLRAFSRSVLRDMDIIHDYNYAQVMTINIVGQGYRLSEVDIPYKVRETGKSFITFRYVFKVFPAIWREWRRVKMEYKRRPDYPSLPTTSTQNK
ncbi:glycosyltransferase family 2 protein [Aneurinibacillus tyrosinisolvens]|uniref:glycosyltransferase family 2 protein n=1 Tax=Aneurinibacillus tyrosinisolvens TaxID=1443435 RepID=UPI00063F7AE0|nr:glycosyltransferase family 2 protein [Aneurinibacillus tyrosinisolvens]